MSLMEEIQELPEGERSHRIAPSFRRTLAGLPKEEALHVLWELADKQWHSYEVLDPEIAADLSEWLLANWDRGSFEDADRGLVPVFLAMKVE
jgi:hypothetical protein